MDWTTFLASVENNFIETSRWVLHDRCLHRRRHAVRLICGRARQQKFQDKRRSLRLEDHLDIDGRLALHLSAAACLGAPPVEARPPVPWRLAGRCVILQRLLATTPKDCVYWMSIKVQAALPYPRSHPAWTRAMQGSSASPPSTACNRLVARDFTAVTTAWWSVHQRVLVKRFCSNSQSFAC
mmetsp:Transcript_149242/g.478039  ORF Transcript_149242/g.478039 Transcript_149242/m.478039 type:complete len:182 (+) Transcript_149242:145-690(+)